MTAGPLSAVLAELTAGTPTLDDVARRTGLDRDVVRAVVEQLVRLGRVRASTLSTSCPDAGCGGCPTSACDSRGTPAPAGRRPVLVALSARTAGQQSSSPPPARTGSGLRGAGRRSR